MTQNADTLLFVCSGNFYRSRFAEAVFNHEALKRRLPWRAESRGFSPHLATDDLSHHAERALELRNIPVAMTRRKPARIEFDDLWDARLTICVNEAEHRPALRLRFPDWEHRVTYWHVHDIDVEPPGTALPALEQNVLDLMANLETGRRPCHHPALTSQPLEF
ncbi:MAG: hypothetical protein KDN19_16825 [Verrucomicrobiae bacterium]|nr:hypothetical protein [Verrucomicrobiae bacterium]